MRILILTNHQVGLYKFRRELLERLISERHKVYASVPFDEFTEELKAIGIKLIDNKYLDRRGTNPIQDLKLLNYYKGLLKKIKPDVVLTYTIKPNVYGGYVCGKYGIPYIANVTGLGTSIQNGGLMQRLTLGLYKVGLRKASRVFFQNSVNQNFMLDQHIVIEAKTDVLPGSGVNTEQNYYEPYPKDDDPIIFTTIGRIMKDKGIDEIVEAARDIKKTYLQTEFRLIGDFDEGYEEYVHDAEQKGIVKYLGFQKNIHKFIAESHAIIHASYHEGMSNILQEAASTGRPVIATDVHGCKEIYEDGVTGFGCRPRDAKSLTDAIKQFISIPYEQKMAMGKAGRKKMEREFSRMIVVDKYMNELKSIDGSRHV